MFAIRLPVAMTSAAMLLAAPIWAAETPPALASKAAPALPTDIFYKNESYGYATLSPKGDKLAFVLPVKGRLALAVREISSGATQVIASDKDWDFVLPTWINDKRLIFFSRELDAAVNPNADAGGDMFAVNADGSSAIRLDSTMQKRYRGNWRGKPIRFLAAAGGNSNEVFVTWSETAEDWDPRGDAVYALDTVTGQRRLQTFGSPSLIRSWVMDQQNQVRVGIQAVVDKSAAQLSYKVLYRDHNKADWRTLWQFKLGEKSFEPIAFDVDGKTMYVIGRRKQDDTAGLFAWDFAKGDVGEPIVTSPNYDVVPQLLRDPASREIQSGYFAGMQLENFHFDDATAQMQADVDAALPGHANRLQVRGHIALVQSHAPGNPGQYYLYDAKAKKLSKLLSTRPELPAAQLAQTQTIHYQARDGQDIPAYLTLPKGREAKNLPLVTLVHGGPAMRDGDHYDPLVQHLAARGYAVLQPQFRMSTGFGWKHFRAGWKQWGLTMQDDVSDGVTALVQQGKVDKQRVCIAGASYGGYAAMFGLIKTPELYRCGINWVGVTDLDKLYDATFRYSGDEYKPYFYTLHADLEKDKDYLKASSVLENASKIKAPTLLAYGSIDYRVPISQGKALRDKLKAQGNEITWIEYEGEGHGWNKEENRVDWGRNIERFLAKHIGDAAQKAEAGL